MINILFVGDMHVEPHDIADAQKVIDFIIDNAQGVDHIVFLGDQFHTHSILHVSVLNFWHKAFQELSIYAKTHALIGNHDIPNDDKNNLNSHLAFRSIARIVPDHGMLAEDLLVVAYKKDPQEFIDICKKYSSYKTVVCHQEFDGAVYENGFYSKHGINPSDIPQEVIISGHIHNRQSFGKVQYVGSPRWKNLNDANEPKMLELITFENGLPISSQVLPTDGICRKIIRLTDVESKPLDISLFDGKNKNYVDIHGTKSYINQRKKIYDELGILVRTFPIKEKTIKVKESDGISKSLSKFVKEFNAPNGTETEVLVELVNERVIW